ncbi:MAG: cation diffusion facilitator family transporter [Pseudomonadota bacterium]|jgi:cation diffusion facilitator family transporter
MLGEDRPGDTRVDPQRFREVRRAGRIGVVLNLVLVVLQIIIGLAAHAQSLVADAMHTLADLLADFLVLWANRKGAAPADPGHPYGHRRIETVASMLLGAGLTLTGAGILIAAANRMQHVDDLPAIGQAAFWMALITLGAKEGLFRYVLRVAERTRSPMLVANAWHARSDAASSLLVAVGIGGSLLGYRFLDPLAAALVGFLIVRMGVKFAYGAIQELIDTGLDQEEVAAIRRTLLETPGVLGLHELRTRRMAHQALVDAHVLVPARISVSEGHYIAEDARRRVLQAHPQVLNVLVHVDAEDDQQPVGKPPVFPPRPELVHHLRTALGEDMPEFEKILLHYLGNRVEAEIFLPPSACGDPRRLAELGQRVRTALAGDPYFREVTLNCRIAPE